MTPEQLQQIPQAIWWLLAAWAFNGIFNSRVAIFVFQKIIDYNHLKNDVSELLKKVTKLEADVTAAHDKIRDLSLRGVQKDV